MFKYAFLLFLSFPIFAQVRYTEQLQKGTVAELPASCAVGQRYFATNATAGANLYLCTSTNTWTQVTSGGGFNVFGLPWQAYEDFCWGTTTSGEVGRFGWGRADNGGGAAFTQVADDQGCLFRVATGTTATNHAGLGSPALFTGTRIAAKTTRFKFRFKLGSSVASHSFEIGVKDPSSGRFVGNGIMLTYRSGTDTNWIILKNSTGAAVCTASAGPSANAYVTLELATAGSSAMTAILYSSATSWDAGETTATDLFSSCSTTITTGSNYSFAFNVRTDTTGAATLNAGGFSGSLQ